MFESICIQGDTAEGTVDPLEPGFLAETLLFYEHVHIVSQSGGLERLVESIGENNLLTLMSDGFIRWTWINSRIGFQHLGDDSSRFQPVNINRTRSREDGTSRNLDDPEEAAEAAFSNRRRARKFCESLAATVGLGDVLTSTVAELEEVDLVEEAARLVVAGRYGTSVIPSDFYYRMEPDGDGFFRVSTNLDMDALVQRERLRRGTDEATVSGSFIASELASMRRELYFSSLYTSEIATTPMNAAMIRVKCADLLAGRDRSARQIEAFQEITVNNGVALQEAITARDRSFSQFIELLNRARRFREWLHGQDATADLVAEYLNEITADSPFSSLPAKVMRFFLLTAAGAATGNTGVGLAIGLADATLVDVLARGWKPNQFVESQFEPFVSPR